MISSVILAGKRLIAVVIQLLHSSTSVEAAETNFLKLNYYSCSQKPINDDHLGQVDES